jgi:hypothetical protein
MLRPAIVAFAQAVAAVLFVVAPVQAASPPNPPPGSVNTQPAGLSSDGQGNPAAYHCGIQAGAGGSNYAAQPAQISSSGASTPTGCGSSAPSSGGDTQTSSSGQKAPSAGAAQTQTQAQSSAAARTGGGDLVPAASVHGTGGGAFGGVFAGLLWIGLLLLLALFALLIGFALGRRRPARVTA